MKKIRNFLFSLQILRLRQVCVLVCLVFVFSFVAFGQEVPPRGTKKNMDSILCRINRVLVLRFQTNKPVTQIRLFVNDKVVKQATFSSNPYKGMRFAITRGEKLIEIDYSADDSTGLGRFVVDRPLSTSNRVGDRTYFGPGADLTLDDWVTVYSLALFDVCYPDSELEDLRKFAIQIK